MNVRKEKCIHCEEKLKPGDVLHPLVGVADDGETVPLFVHYDCLIDSIADVAGAEDAGGGDEGFTGQDFDNAKGLFNKVFGDEPRTRRRRR